MAPSCETVTRPLAGRLSVPRCHPGRVMASAEILDVPTLRDGDRHFSTGHWVIAPLSGDVRDDFATDTRQREPCGRS